MWSRRALITASTAKMIADVAPIESASAAVAEPEIATSRTTRTRSLARRSDCGAIQIAQIEATKAGPPAPRTSFAANEEWS